MKPFLLIVCSFIIVNANCQINKPRLEAYVAPGIFLENISNDYLVIPSKKDSWQAGGIISYVFQAAVPLKNKRFTIKAGAGFSQRTYTINKYSGRLFGNLFGVDLITDSFDIRKIHFKNNYFQIPLSVCYTVTKPYHNFQLSFGLQFSQNFLLNNHTFVHFDSSYKNPTQIEVNNAHNEYSANISKFIFVAQPFVESIIYTNSKFGVLMQLALPSYYGTRLDKKLTTSTVELIGFKFGAFYSFGK